MGITGVINWFGHMTSKVTISGMMRDAGRAIEKKGNRAEPSG